MTGAGRSTSLASAPEVTTRLSLSRNVNHLKVGQGVNSFDGDGVEQEPGEEDEGILILAHETFDVGRFDMG